MTQFRRIKCAKVQPNDNNNRITVEFMDNQGVLRTYTVNQRILNRYDTAEEAQAALDNWTLANLGYVINDIWLHKNLDGVTWAIATGASPPEVWPEDGV